MLVKHSPIFRTLSLGLLAAMALSGCQQDAGAGAAAGGERPPTQVAVVTLKPQTVKLTSELPGRTVATRQAEVRPQITGLIQRRLFEEGSHVEAGQQLYQIDPARYDAALSTARANLARAKANLNSSDTQYKRYQELLKDKAVSQRDFDNAEASYLQGKAEVAVADAAVKTAQIDLAYTKVLAPISGRIGKSNVTEGALVTAGQAATLATIHQLDPIYVDVAQPAKELLKLRRQAMAGTLQRDDLGKVQILMEDGSLYEHAGTMQFSEMSVNQSTGSVTVRALVPNPDHLLMPGLFVRAVLEEGARNNALLVPQRGVTRNRQGEATALVVAANNTVESRTLQLGQTINNHWLVESGLQAGDRVIVEGLQKTAPGAPVQAVELNAETASTTPTTKPAQEG
ncbi:efflux RND transporter periplasmic adaptor subunit [Teredinibacter turnerae]|uniref:efflux RND transporter periplasmic adaptor subunit n=1 Tax=Teredinibacter turnerae TaxID=2426 RepID=UPI0003F5CFE9|nr:efflux RND transporter periplasmic adaptor subunit [Teredinibacter turnerae]